MLDNYCKQVRIEANTMIYMAQRMIIPAIEAYVGRLCKTIEGKKAVASDISCESEIDVVRKLSGFSDGMYKKVEELKKIHEKTGEIESVLDQSKAIRDEMLPVMDELRCFADNAEEMVGRVCWPLPSYGELLNHSGIVPS